MSSVPTALQVLNGPTAINTAQAHMIPGVDHGLTRADFITAIAAQKGFVTDFGPNNGMKNGERIRILGEEGSRVAVIGSDAASTHFRTVAFGSGKTILLAAETNAVLAQAAGTTPATGDGSDGDVRIDYTNLLMWTKAAGAWTNQGPRGGAAFAAVDNIQADVGGTGVLPDTALENITPYTGAAAGVLTLPSAATAWAAKKYGTVFVLITNVGIPSFGVAGTDTLESAAGVVAGVQYGYIQAQVFSASKWVVVA